ncbi:MAG: ftsH2, partial [Streptomyces oryziradicis]|nr:ftsH2 [Actinacidiphila oryziradicis]
GAEADIEALASASDGFTPADIAHAARTVAQAIFERTIDTGERPPHHGPLSGDDPPDPAHRQQGDGQ